MCFTVTKLLTNSRGTASTNPKRPVLPPTTEVEEPLVHPFKEEEHRRGIAALKNNKVAGIDGVLVEQV